MGYPATDPRHDAHRREHWLRAEVHTYAVPLTPKTLRETLAVAEAGLHALGRERPGYQAGGTIASHLERIALLIEECERKRPTGNDGKHGDRHTPECGCRP